MTLDKEDIATAKEMAKQLQDSDSNELIVVGNLLTHLLMEREALSNQKPAFHGFMIEDECCVNICYTPWAPGGPDNVLPTAYYTSPQPEPKSQLLFEVDGEMLTAQQLAGVELFNFQEATGCDTADEFLAQQKSQVEPQNMSTIEIDLSDDEFRQIAKLAHERDITFNQMVEIIIQEEIDRLNDLHD